jgi:translation initiation factor 3 subunit K
MADGNELENEVIGLLQTRRYDPAILQRLEEYVNYQVSAQRCDAETNLAVLKLYQFYPAHYNASTVAKILIKALMTLPSTDFLCALYLIPERRQVDEPIPVITQLASLLETGRFREFWEASGSCADLLASVPGAVDAVRAFMVGVVSRTYRTVDRSVLAELLSLDGPELDAVVRGNEWVEGTDRVVTIPANEENQPKPPTVDERLSFQQVAARML